jgi:glyoxylase-like metal-dependent hydrolase (beta-lactamase superfamily II)
MDGDRQPGHTDESVALWHEDSRTLLSGDAVITIGAAARSAPDTVDDDATQRTQVRLRGLPVVQVLPGHGLPIQSSSIWRR